MKSAHAETLHGLKTLEEQLSELPHCDQVINRDKEGSITGRKSWNNQFVTVVQQKWINKT